MESLLAAAAVVVAVAVAASVTSAAGAVVVLTAGSAQTIVLNRVRVRPQSRAKSFFMIFFFFGNEVLLALESLLEHCQSKGKLPSSVVLIR